MNDSPIDASGRFAGRYRIERELGRGATATVYLAHDSKDERQVAVKVLRPELIESRGAQQFLREIRLTAELHHPHIVSLLDECPHNYPQNPTTVLKVLIQSTSVAYVLPENYPPVTRISEWQDDHYAIGLRCAAAWCEMGPLAFTVRPPVSEPGPPREGDIKGWHDEQRLAVLEAATNKLVPSDLVGKATPVPNLENLSEADFASEQLVGTIWFNSDVDPIKHRKYFEVGFRKKGPNLVYSQRMSATAWQTRIKFAGGAEKVFTVIRTAHADISVPGTMRWYWSKTDEGLWYRCGGACCEVEW